MKKVFLLFLFCLSLVCLANAQTTKIEQCLIRGDEYYEKKDYRNAIKEYSEVIKIRLEQEEKSEEEAKSRASNRDFYQYYRTWTGDEINAYLYRGHSHYFLNNYDKAIDDYLVVKKNYDPDFYYIYVCLGDAYGAKGDYKNAAENYKLYVQKKPADKSGGFSVDKSNKADMWFCAVLLEQKRLSDDSKYEKWLKEIIEENNITLAEIESFYKKNRGW